MANTKLSALSEALSAASNDVLYLVDVSDDTQSPEGTGKKITKENLLGSNFDTIQITEGTTSANGINFGNDVTLYRSTADTLFTDDKMVVAGGELNVGVADSQSGTITLYGNGAATDEGGQLNINLAADYDTTFESWVIDANQDDLRFFTSDAGVTNVMTAEGQLQLPKQGNTGGLLMGDDVKIYRLAANELGTEDTLTHIMASSVTSTLKLSVSGDTNQRFETLASGLLRWGSGSAAGDTNLYRKSANTLKTDDNFEANSIKIYSDLGSGEASTTTLTNATDTPTTDPGWTTSSTVNMNAPDGYIKAYVGTQAVVIPYWNT